MSYDLLDGVRVVEVSMYAFAPSCAAVLADWGADVIKVLPTDVDDPMRGNPVAGLPAVDVGVAFMYEQMNRGKRVRRPSTSPTTAVRACSTSSSPPPTCSSPTCCPMPADGSASTSTTSGPCARTSIYARASGHGAKGPEAATGGFDHTDFWARTGIAHAASMVSDEFVPQAGPALGDLTSGGFLAGGIAAALFRRERTGPRRGRRRVAAVVGGLGLLARHRGQRPLRHRRHPAEAPQGPAQPAGRRLPHRRRPRRSTSPACRPTAASRTSAR